MWQEARKGLRWDTAAHACRRYSFWDVSWRWIYNNYASKYISVLFSASLHLGYTHVHWKTEDGKKAWIIAGIIYSDFTED